MRHATELLAELELSGDGSVPLVPCRLRSKRGGGEVHQASELLRSKRESDTLETIEDVEETTQGGAPLLPARLISKRGGGEVRLAEEL